jgi:hypothetical protein
LALVDVDLKFGNATVPFILNNDRTALVSNLSTALRRFSDCLNVVDQFNTVPINYGHLTMANMKVVARHLEQPPGGKRNEHLLDPSCAEFRICCGAVVIIGNSPINNANTMRNAVARML